MEHSLKGLDYDLPESLIAQSPLPDRAGSRLLWVNRETRELRDCRFRELPELLRRGDLLVRNDARVLPARIRGRREVTGGTVEALLVEEERKGAWWALVRPARRVRVGDALVLSGDLHARVESLGEDGRRLLVFADGVDVPAHLRRHGEVPLPPYIRGPIADSERYQTVYSTAEVAVAAPTAGLHFTPEVASALTAQGIQIADLTLHVGPGTFQPIRVEDYTRHRMHPERYRIGEGTSRLIRAAIEERRRIVAVGTTSLRVLESLGMNGLDGTAREGSTDLYVTPGYSFSVVGALLTNFHLPRTTLLALVMAFAGEQLVKDAYTYAVSRGYRFYSLGDACLFV